MLGQDLGIVDDLDARYTGIRYIEITTDAPVACVREDLSVDSDQDPIQLKRSPVVAAGAVDGKLLAQCFDGRLVLVEESSIMDMQDLVVPALPEGGFDAVLAPLVDPVDSTTKIIAALAERDYCVVQTCSSPDELRTAGLAAEALLGWMRLVPDFEVSYCGRSSESKVLWFDADQAEGTATEILQAFDREVFNLTEALFPMTPALGFFGVERTAALLRAPCSGEAESQKLRQEAAEFNAVESGMLEEYLSFVERRKVGLVQPLGAKGGSLTLHPRHGGEDIRLPLHGGQLLLFRHDIFDYTFEQGESVVLQAWILRERLQGDLVGAQFSQGLAQAAKRPTPPSYGATTEMVNCTSFACTLGGNCNESEDFYSMLSAATDGPTRVPILRYDLDQYWSEEDEPGKMYVQHFGMLSFEQMGSFDAEFFGFTVEEARQTAPTTRKSIEAAYEALARAGWTRSLLQGAAMTVSGACASDLEGLMLHGFGDVAINENLHWMLSQQVVSNRLQYIFGMRGPCFVTDTACSSSLTATAMGHSTLRPYQPKQMAAGAGTQRMRSMIIYGAAGQFEPSFCIGLCGAHMLSHKGRCFTFDQSADGFIRSEGMGAMYWHVDTKDDPLFLAELVGSSCNQDGRSASLTAPHGPSQQECIRQSLKEANADPLQIQIQELHGTGTSLGDPIEVGALRATMMMHKGKTRDHPLVKTSSKANIGHSEVAAGITGIMKCVVMSLYAVATPNLHLRLLNPHIDDNGYPVVFTPEAMDQGKPDGFYGVSSFGFSGCNARGDIWGTAQKGTRGSGDLDLTADRWLRVGEGQKLASIPWRDQKEQTKYEGLFMIGDTRKNIWELYISGTWNRLQKERMLPDSEGRHTFMLQLGDTLVESFILLAGNSEENAIFPAARHADATSLVLGPGKAPPGHRWLVDARGLGLPAGSFFKVVFEWVDTLQVKRVSWSPVPAPSPGDDGLPAAAYEHSYFIVGSWTSWRPMRMKTVSSNAGGGTHEMQFRIGINGFEKFHIWRDSDRQQIIYPAEDDAIAVHVALRGPDEDGRNKRWRIPGLSGEVITARLTVRDGNMSVSVSSQRKGQRSWSYRAASAGHGAYYVVGTWSNEPVQMTDAGDGIHTARVNLEGLVEAYFQIWVDKDKSKAIYPEMHAAFSGSAMARGPDGAGEDYLWRIEPSLSPTCDIVLDWNQVDPRKRVVWSSDDAAAARVALVE